MESYMSVVRKILRMKIQVSKKLKKIDWCFYQNAQFVAKKNPTFIKNQETSND